MGAPSFAASNAVIYLTYGAFLATGLFVAWKLRRQTRSDYLSSNRTQKAIPLALNFIASGECTCARNSGSGLGVGFGSSSSSA
ncbi:uncharacterized protein K452DRAFT_219750 [Aplosporella prunicola CBS 121167]|uniref:Uncharacterized protein n=1 Tax=Aplosporella prunicola CBS 121167 TaxID=1176127 RepID=A0A6A6BU93_9PEZI|nr:uncharacterized protein K452DRAFT_219750 [Aplosporella prunicola CBS 121167]KAF2146211.1 hypothetical protein K452DRAFT_219750 [Aplosporella prunicola CBS 121167]